MWRLSRFLRIMTNEMKVENPFMKASHKILSSHWSAQFEEPVWTPYEGSNAVSVFRPCFVAGIAQNAFDTAVDYSAKRTSFGSPISKLQMVQSKIADMALRYLLLFSMLFL